MKKYLYFLLSLFIALQNADAGTLATGSTGGGGGGTVTSVADSSGFFSVANPTTTPNFSFANQPAGSILNNISAASGQPAFTINPVIGSSSQNASLNIISTGLPFEVTSSAVYGAAMVINSTSGGDQWQFSSSTSTNNCLGCFWFFDLSTGYSAFSVVGNSSSNYVSILSNGAYTWGTATQYLTNTIQAGMTSPSAGVVDIGSSSTQGDKTGTLEAALVNSNLNVTGSTAPTNGMYLKSASLPAITSAGAAVIAASGSGTLANYLLVQTAATANPSIDTISAIGTDSNINIGAVPKGTGYFGAPGLVSTGTKFTAVGCSNSVTVGGATAGTYKSGTAGSCSVVVTMGNSVTAPNGWACSATDRTTSADLITQTASTTNTATLVGTTVLNDIISFNCMGY